jgi:hypothetical protein
LFVNILIPLAIPVKLVADSSSRGSGHNQTTAAIRPLLVVNGTTVAGRFGVKQGTDITTTTMLNERGTIDERTSPVFNKRVTRGHQINLRPMTY